MAEDLSELIEGYFLPRVRLYIDKMHELLNSRQDYIGPPLVYRNTDTDMPNRLSDWSSPRGLLRWSAYGVPCEPELTADDLQLVESVIPEREPERQISRIRCLARFSCWVHCLHVFRCLTNLIQQIKRR